jgi:transcriptional antiterminator RfaH
MPLLKREPDVFPESLFDLSGPWWVAHLRSRQEKAFARYLRDFEIPYYLPQMEKRVRREGRTLVSYLPLFSGYVFFRGGKAETSRALRSHLIANLLEPPDQTEINAELLQLRELQLAEGKLHPYPFVGLGDPVLITEGAFQGYRGVVVREKGSERLIVSVSFIRQSVSVELAREAIRRSGKAARG